MASAVREAPWSAVAPATALRLIRLVAYRTERLKQSKSKQR